MFPQTLETHISQAGTISFLLYPMDIQDHNCLNLLKQLTESNQKPDL